MDLGVELGKVLLDWGPSGVIAAVFYWLYREEVKAHDKDVAKLEAVVAEKDELIVATLRQSNEAIDRAGERMAGLVEKSAASANTMQNVVNLLERQR